MYTYIIKISSQISFITKYDSSDLKLVGRGCSSSSFSPLVLAIKSVLLLGEEMNAEIKLRSLNNMCTSNSPEM